LNRSSAPVSLESLLAQKQRGGFALSPPYEYTMSYASCYVRLELDPGSEACPHVPADQVVLDTEVEPKNQDVDGNPAEDPEGPAGYIGEHGDTGIVHIEAEGA
jgi:hypothetical protein